VGNLARSTTVPDLTATVAKLNGTLDKGNQALDTINAPCIGNQPCRGTLGSINKAIMKIGDMAVTSQRQVAQTGALVTATAQTMTQAGESIKDVSGRLSGTADAATGLLSAGQTDLQTARPSIAALQPLLAHTDAVIGHADERIQAFAPLETNLQNLTGHLSGIAFDAQQVADAETKRYFAPVKWYLWPVKRIGQVWDIGAAVARNVP
jgi:ABC-type transporter Mla subunit MlaD